MTVQKGGRSATEGPMKNVYIFLGMIESFSLSRAISSDHSLFCHGYRIPSSIDEDFYSDRHSRLI